MLRDRFLAQPAEVRGTLRRPPCCTGRRSVVRAGRTVWTPRTRYAARSLSGCWRAPTMSLRFTPAVLGRCRRVHPGRGAGRAAPGPRRGRPDACPSGCGTEPWPTRGPTPTSPASSRRPEPTRPWGAREIATELYLLAADRAPCDLSAERVEWLATAVETGALGNQPSSCTAPWSTCWPGRRRPRWSGCGWRSSSCRFRRRRHGRDADRRARRRRRRRLPGRDGAAAAGAGRAHGVPPVGRRPARRPGRRACCDGPGDRRSGACADRPRRRHPLDSAGATTHVLAEALELSGHRRRG